MNKNLPIAVPYHSTVYSPYLKAPPKSSSKPITKHYNEYLTKNKRETSITQFKESRKYSLKGFGFAKNLTSNSSINLVAVSIRNETLGTPLGH